MAKAGQTKAVTTKKKDFAGTGVEGQKGADAEQDDKAAATQDSQTDTEAVPPAAAAAAMQDEKTDTPAPAVEKAPAFDTTGATYTITHRHGGPKKVWFRDGKEIGVEDAG